MLWKLSFFELKSHTHASRQLATPNYWSPNSCPLQLAPERLKIFLNLSTGMPHGSRDRMINSLVFCIIIYCFNY